VSARKRVEVARLGGKFVSVGECAAAHVVYAFGQVGRVVTVEWDGAMQQLVFYATAPVPKKAEAVVEKLSGRSSRSGGQRT
jgi:hypothetical protein